jgi:hypothetical protein
MVLESFYTTNVTDTERVIIDDIVNALSSSDEKIWNFLNVKDAIDGIEGKNYDISQLSEHASQREAYVIKVSDKEKSIDIAFKIHTNEWDYTENICTAQTNLEYIMDLGYTPDFLWTGLIEDSDNKFRVIAHRYFDGQKYSESDKTNPKIQAAYKEFMTVMKPHLEITFDESDIMVINENDNYRIVLTDLNKIKQIRI